MLVTTAKPLSFEQMIDLSETNDAIINLDSRRCRYLMLSEGQDLEVPIIHYDYNKNLVFGIRPVGKPNNKYEYIAFTIN